MLWGGMTNIFWLGFAGLALAAAVPAAATAQTGGDPLAAIAADIGHGDFVRLDAADTSALPPASALLVMAERAASRGDDAGVDRALAAYAATGDGEPARRAIAAGVEAKSAFARGQYARAADAARRHMTLLAKADPRDEAQDAAQTYAVAALLASAPAQRLVSREAKAVAAPRDAVGLVRTDIAINGATESAVLDTGANLSVLSASAAKRLGVRLIDGAAAVGSSTRDAVPVRIGVADRLEIGGLTLANVAFLVIDDAQLAIPVPDYRIDAIIGYPVFRAAGGATFTADGRFTLAPPPVTSGIAEAVLRAAGNDLLVGARVSGLPVALHLDSGATATGLSADFARRYPDAIAGLPTRSARSAGAGGTTTHTAAVLADATLTFGNRAFKLPEISVELGSAEGTDWLGTIGQDVLRIPAWYGIDLKRMRLVLGPDGASSPR